MSTTIRCVDCGHKIHAESCTAGFCLACKLRFDRECKALLDEIATDENFKRLLAEFRDAIPQPSSRSNEPSQAIVPTVKPTQKIVEEITRQVSDISEDVLKSHKVQFLEDYQVPSVSSQHGM
jgi:hypothetical protein